MNSCELCGNEIKKLEDARDVLPWGATCGDCIKEMALGKGE